MRELFKMEIKGDVILLTKGLSSSLTCSVFTLTTHIAIKKNTINRPMGNWQWHRSFFCLSHIAFKFGIHWGRFFQRYFKSVGVDIVEISGTLWCTYDIPYRIDVAINGWKLVHTQFIWIRHVNGMNINKSFFVGKHFCDTFTFSMGIYMDKSCIQIGSDSRFIHFYLSKSICSSNPTIFPSKLSRNPHFAKFSLGLHWFQISVDRVHISCHF